jgi:hypothetical protein
MKLTVGKLNETHATLHISGVADGLINISGTQATIIALRVARSFNRDMHFSALVAALSPFRSSEMGALLVGMIDVREEGAGEAQMRLSRLISMIDVILEAVEQHEDGANDDLENELQ